MLANGFPLFLSTFAHELFAVHLCLSLCGFVWAVPCLLNAKAAVTGCLLLRTAKRRLIMG